MRELIINEILSLFSAEFYNTRGRGSAAILKFGVEMLEFVKQVGYSDAHYKKGGAFYLRLSNLLKKETDEALLDILRGCLREVYERS